MPASVKRLQCDDVVYRDLANEGATSPIIMSWRTGDASPELLALVRFGHALYRSAEVSRPDEG